MASSSKFKFVAVMNKVMGDSFTMAGFEEFPPLSPKIFASVKSHSTRVPDLGGSSSRVSSLDGSTTMASST